MDRAKQEQEKRAEEHEQHLQTMDRAKQEQEKIALGNGVIKTGVGKEKTRRAHVTASSS